MCICLSMYTTYSICVEKNLFEGHTLNRIKKGTKPERCNKTNMEMQVFKYTLKQKAQKSLSQLVTGFGFLTLKERRKPQTKRKEECHFDRLNYQIKPTFIVYLLMLMLNVWSWENLHCRILQ